MCVCVGGGGSSNKTRIGTHLEDRVSQSMETSLHGRS